MFNLAPLSLHGDHSEYIPKAQKYGLKVYSCQEVADKFNGVIPLKVNQSVRLGGFIVQPMKVPHSCECYAYLIKHELMGKLLFITDCTHFRYKIKEVNHLFIEANYSDELIIDNISAGATIRSKYNQHMEIEETIRAIKANYSHALMNICLLHLSDSNANANLFCDRIRDEFGFSNVFVARQGETIPLIQDEF